MAKPSNWFHMSYLCKSLWSIRRRHECARIFGITEGTTVCHKSQPGRYHKADFDIKEKLLNPQSQEIACVEG